jgi:hypothetical protein
MDCETNDDEWHRWDYGDDSECIGAAEGKGTGSQKGFFASLPMSV